MPTDPGTALPPAHMHVAAGACASRCPSRTGIAEAMGSRGAAPRSMSWATMRQRARAALVPGSASRVKVWVPQQWLANTSAPGVSAQDRRRLDLVLYGATRLGEALCCDATLVASLRRDGRPQPQDGAAIAVARRGAVPGALPAWPAAAGRSCL